MTPTHSFRPIVLTVFSFRDCPNRFKKMKLFQHFHKLARSKSPKVRYNFEAGLHSRRDSMTSGFSGPPTASGQSLCGLNKRRSLVVKSRVKSLATSAMSELDHENIISQN